MHIINIIIMEKRCVNNAYKIMKYNNSIMNKYEADIYHYKYLRFLPLMKMKTRWRIHTPIRLTKVC